VGKFGVARRRGGRYDLAVDVKDKKPVPSLPVVTASTPALQDVLSARTTAGELYEWRSDGLMRCVACAHGCVFDHDRTGACGVRARVGESLQVPFGYVARKYVRSVETNTVFHVLPGARALTFGMYGCDLKCPYCHNHKVSQALREGVTGELPIDVTAEQLVEEAVAAGCAVLCAAYNEPMIAAEWVHAVFTRAKARGLVTALITDGHATPQAINYVRNVTDVYRVDLKGIDDAQYRTLGGRVGPVLASIEHARSVGLWVELVTLVVPGFNDDPRSLKRMAQAIVGIDAAMPWHLNAMMPRYRLKDGAPTAPMTLLTAVGAAYGRGLRFVYASNLLSLGELGHTRCDGCREVLVERHDYETQRVQLTGGRCPKCAREIPGIWQVDASARVAFGTPGEAVDGSQPTVDSRSQVAPHS
jgi:pyruvate formate lyase activating enzyme